MATNKTWFVTGTSKGLGLILIKALLANGNNVVATTRNIKVLEDEIGVSEHFFPLSMDLTDPNNVKSAIHDAINKFGTIDVVVNNAGFGQVGTLEELSDIEARKNFDVNFFGTLNVIREVMPYLRARQSGHIINISSMAGIQGYIPGWGIYCASKFAVAGLTEALAAEVKDFGIKVTLVYPGHMRTSFLSDDSVQLPLQPISAYTSVRQNEQNVKKTMHGQQIGDPNKAAQLLMKISELKYPPLHYFLGEDVYDAALEKVKVLSTALDSGHKDALSIGF